MTDGHPTAARASRSPGSAAFVIGLALSGFFDGILLHQILQWHHFLSLVPGETFRDLRVQVYADGLFHVAVYAVTVIGLWLLWRARECLAAPGAAARVCGGALLGFGVWNIVDVGVFHWILGIHRVRLNVADPLAYDLAWFVGLGVLIALVAAIPIANIPAENDNTLVVFRPGIGLAEAINAIMAADGGIVMIDPLGGFAVVRLAAEGSSLPLYRAGALLVTRSPAFAGCLAFTTRA